MHRSNVSEHVLNTIVNFRINVNDICKYECHNIKEVYEELRASYCPNTPRSVILKRAHVAENAIRKTVSEKNYNGLREEGCIRLALALGIDNETDIDYLLNARGYAGLSECNRTDYVIWRHAVRVVLELINEYPDVLLSEDAVIIFEELVKKA